jgi:hypothetical protein
MPIGTIGQLTNMNVRSTIDVFLIKHGQANLSSRGW